MYGFKVQYIKTSMLLFAVLVGFSFAYYDLSHALFWLLVMGVGVLAVPIAISRNAFKQTHTEDAQAAMMPSRRGKKFSVTVNRRRRNQEMLPAEATVSLA